MIGSPRPPSTSRPNGFHPALQPKGQIGELAGDNQAALLDLIDEAAGAQECRRDLDAASRAFFATRARIREMQADLERRGEVEVALEDNARALTLYEEAGHARCTTGVSRDRTPGTRDRAALCRSGESIREAKASPISCSPKTSRSPSLTKKAPVTTATGPPSPSSDRCTASLQTRGPALNEAADTAQQLIAKQRSALQTSAWRANADKAQTDYEAALAALAAERIGDTRSHARVGARATAAERRGSPASPSWVANSPCARTSDR